MAASTLAETCEELDVLGWPSNRHAFFGVCDAAAELLGVMRECTSEEAAKDAAQSAMDALGDP